MCWSSLMQRRPCSSATSCASPGLLLAGSPRTCRLCCWYFMYGLFALSLYPSVISYRMCICSFLLQRAGRSRFRQLLSVLLLLRNSPELAQPISGRITALSDHSSSVGRSVHARLPVPVAVAGFWSGLVYRARVLQHCAARSPVQFFWIAWKFPS